MQIWMQVFSTRKEKKNKPPWPKQFRLSQWGAAMQASPGSRTSSIHGKKTRRIRSHHMCITWILWPTYAPKPPQNHVGIWNHLEDPPESHLEKAQGRRAHPGVDRPHRLAEQPLARLNLVFHVWAPGWLLDSFRGCLRCLMKLASPYK
jgi:hypothetical protein